MAFGVDDSINKISLQDKVKFLENLKKIKAAEIKEKEEKLSKEIADLEEKRKKELKALEEEMKQETSKFDEEMFKAMDALFFTDRRTFLMNRARLERKQEIVDDSNSARPKGESFLYDISEKIFSGQNMKLREIVSFEAYSKVPETENRGYMSSSREGNSLDMYRRESVENKYESGSGGYPEQNPLSANYSSRSKSWLENFNDSWGERRNY